MHVSAFAQGVLVSSAVWLLSFLVHKCEHLCMPKGKVFRMDEEGNKVFYKSPWGIIKQYL